VHSAATCHNRWQEFDSHCRHANFPLFWHRHAAFAAAASPKKDYILIKSD
jgi:hypothetical protein